MNHATDSAVDGPYTVRLYCEDVLPDTPCHPVDIVDEDSVGSIHKDVHPVGRSSAKGLEEGGHPANITIQDASGDRVLASHQRCWTHWLLSF
jgi:hypothetical protein